VDAYACSRSAGAIVLGCEHFAPDLRFAGVLCNRVAGEWHREAIRNAIGRHCSAAFLGALPNDPELRLPERQLGLVSVHEHGLPETMLGRLRETIEAHIDLNALLAGAQLDHSPFAVSSNREGADAPSPSTRARIGVARDEAFCFYYDDNLRLLREAGAELVPFSPLNDADLPPNIGGIYLGGGFPEEFAARLAGNAAMVQAVRGFKGMILAECGGLIYLCRSFVDLNGVAHDMIGRVPGRIGMTRRLQACGYREVTVQRDCPLASAGTVVRGHEFHWSQWIERPGRGWGALRAGADAFGYSDERTLASYFHFHLGSHPALAEWIVRRAGIGGR
jgi:cobyrinic acid a,c-diamide synthase